MNTVKRKICIPWLRHHLCQEFRDKFTEMNSKRDPIPVLDRNPAYGTNTAAAAPDIDTEKNKAYGYLESRASFTGTMVDNSAYGTAEVAIIDT